MTTLSRAIAIAAEAHAGQTDKAGQPYILHPFRVMLRMETNTSRMVAVLHDVLEDCPEWTYQRLLETEGFSYPVASAVDILTRRKGESYERYIQDVARDPLAIIVKLGDLADNLDPARPWTAGMPVAIRRRYELAREVLTEAARAEA